MSKQPHVHKFDSITFSFEKDRLTVLFFCKTCKELQAETHLGVKRKEIARIMQEINYLLDSLRGDDIPF